MSAPGTPRSRALLLVCALASSLVLAAGCASGPRASGEDAAGRATLVVRSEVPDAVVWVDDRMIGEVATLAGGMRLRPGFHRVEVRHDRYHTRYLEVELARGETRTVDLSLAEVLD